MSAFGQKRTLVIWAIVALSGEGMYQIIRPAKYILLIIFILSFHTGWSAETDSKLSSESKKWSEALLEKDIDELTYFALPEYKANVKKKLMDNTSNIYMILFKNSNSAYEIIKRSTDLSINIFQHDKLKEFGRGTTVCYSDKLYSNLSMEDHLKSLDSFCAFFSYGDAQWYISYEFN
jgi:hypothetical protein